MKSLAALLLALPLTLAVPASSSSLKRSDASHGVVSLPLRRETGPRSLVSGSRRLQRAARLDKAATQPPPRQSLVDRSEYYLADLGIGTPPQPVSLLVDTGGWVTWVNPDCAYAARQAECSALPQYNPSASNPSPRRVHALDQVISYGLTMGASLEGYADVFTWGNSSKVPAQPFGVANATVGLSTAVLSLGPDGRDGFDSAASNASVVATLAQQGRIASRVFSLAYGHVVEVGRHAGALVLGGVDRSRFRGPLGKTAILPRDDSVDAWRYWVAVTGVQHHSHKKNGTAGSITTSSFPTAGGFNGTYMLDSGTTGIYVARDTFDAVLAEMNLTRNPLRPEGFPDVDCGLRNATGSLSFTFAGRQSTAGNATTSNSTAAPGFTIDVPYASLVHPETNLLTNDSSRCFFAFSSGGSAYDDGDTFPILGVEFFKAAYAVFDWDNREVALAQGAVCGEPDLVPVGKGPDAVPSLTGNCK